MRNHLRKPLSVVTLLILCALYLAPAELSAQAPAFPGAEGHGRYTRGGRATNGTTKIYRVTNLNDSGTGSLRWALQQSGPRTIVFEVGGIIELKSDLAIPSNTTIAGQTAPAPGITLRYYTVTPTGNNIIMRFIRIRRGQEKDINDGADATWARNLTNIVLDHCSFSWSIDEIASYYDNRDFTMQWCSLGEALANPGHSKGEHSYGGIWGGKCASFHHNMIQHVHNRCPRLNGARYGWQGYDKTKYANTIEAERVDLRNCVFYNWGSGNGAYAGMGGYHNIVNNYYKAGPATRNKTRVFQCGHTTGTSTDNGSAIDPKKKGIYGHFYINGNYVTAASSPANYDWKGVIVDDDNNNTVRDTIKLNAPIETGEVTTHTAEVAYEKVLDYVGASLYRDAVDKRYMKEARNGTTTYTGSASKQGDGSSITHYPGIIDFVSDQGEYTLESTRRSASFDEDEDGMADEWEQLNGGDLNPNDYDLDPVQQWYTNLEVYLNSLVEDIMKGGNADAVTAVDEYYPTCVKINANPEQDPDSGTDGAIVWPFNEGKNAKNANIDSFISDGISSTSVTLGSELSYEGTQNVSGAGTETRIQQNNPSASTATDANAVTFSLTTATGHQFKANRVSVTATRIGTDRGSIDIKWIDKDGVTPLVTGVIPNRNNDTTQPYSVLSYKLGDDAVPTEGTCSLVVNIYELSFMKDDTPQYKSVGLCNITIDGTLFAPAGIATPVTITAPVSTKYYSLDGRRLSEPQHGVNIRVARGADGRQTSTKIVR